MPLGGSWPDNSPIRGGDHHDRRGGILDNCCGAGFLAITIGLVFIIPHISPVLAAVQKDGHALQYASKEFRNDREAVLAAGAQAEWLD